MKVLCVEGTWVVRTKGEIDPQVTYSGCRSLRKDEGVGWCRVVEANGETDAKFPGNC